MKAVDGQSGHLLRCQLQSDSAVDGRGSRLSPAYLSAPAAAPRAQPLPRLSQPPWTPAHLPAAGPGRQLPTAAAQRASGPLALRQQQRLQAVRRRRGVQPPGLGCPAARRRPAPAAAGATAAGATAAGEHARPAHQPLARLPGWWRWSVAGGAAAGSGAAWGWGPLGTWTPAAGWPVQGGSARAFAGRHRLAG